MKQFNLQEYTGRQQIITRKGLNMKIIYKETIEQKDCFENFENMYIYFRDSEIKNCLNSFKIDASSGESIQRSFEDLERLLLNSNYKSLVIEEFKTSPILSSYISMCLEYLKNKFTK